MYMSVFFFYFLLQNHTATINYVNIGTLLIYRSTSIICIDTAVPFRDLQCIRYVRSFFPWPITFFSCKIWFESSCSYFLVEPIRRAFHRAFRIDAASYNISQPSFHPNFLLAGSYSGIYFNLKIVPFAYLFLVLLNSLLLAAKPKKSLYRSRLARVSSVR